MSRKYSRTPKSLHFGWSLTRIEPPGASSKMRSGHIYFMKDNLLHTISKLHHVWFYVVTKVLSSTMHTANIEIRECVNWSLTRG